jgi:hypothetical protein
MVLPWTSTVLCTGRSQVLVSTRGGTVPVELVLVQVMEKFNE